jgi:GNAT superfamily N-acetyltransferase
MIPAIEFIELSKTKHDRKSFDCGTTELNQFIHDFAVRHRAAGISKTMVLPEKDSKNICAYYTLSHSQIKRETLPSSHSKKLPYYPVPVLLIAQLAVHLQAQKQGLGKITLVQALRHCLKINMHLPSFAVVVDTLHNGVQAFYEQYGFQLLDVQQSKRMRLFLPMKTVAALFA